MQFRVLGPLEVLDQAGRTADIGGSQPRKLIAALLAAEEQVVSIDALVDAVWRDDPPPSAAATLQSYISRLRRQFDDAPLVREATGYRLVADAACVDFRRFEAQVERARALLDIGQLADARSVLNDALALWRGDAFADFPDVDLITGRARRLDELRLAALDDRITADLGLGRHALVVGELGQLVEQHPFRESLRGHLALALYRSGRQAEALRALDAARRTLVDELGVDPGAELRELEAAILRQDHSLVLPGRNLRQDSSAGRLHGRTGELQELRSALDEATTATRVVILEGVAGIGKTRLAQELATDARGHGFDVFWGSTYEGGAAPAYWPWLPPLRSMVEANSTGSPVHAALASLLDPASSAHSPVAGPDPGRFTLVDAVADLLAASGARRPVLLVLDDVQWADAASLELLTAVMHRLVEVPLLVICTVREPVRGDALVSTFAQLARRPGTRRLQLRGLAVASTSDLIEQTTGERPDDETLAAVHQRAGGNPFFVTEMARLLAAGEGLIDVPAGARDVLRHRLVQLPPDTVSLLGVAAVIGRETDVELLARAADRPLHLCLDQIEPAIDHQLLVEVPDRPGTFEFAHALVREVLADDLSSLRRARLHLRIADALPTGDDTAEIVAEHLWQAASIAGGRRAAEALERAALVATRRLAYVVADDLLERAIRLRQATRVDERGPALELDALLQLLMVRSARLGYIGVPGMPILARAKQLAEQLGRSGDLMALLWMEWAGFDLARETQHSEAMAVELLTRGEASGGAAERVVGHTAFGIARWHRGDFVESADHFDQACVLIPDVDPEEVSLQQFGADPLRLAAPFAVYIHELLGDRSDETSDAGYLAAVELYANDPLWELVVMSFGASAAVSLGRPDRALQWTRHVDEVDPDDASWYWTAMIDVYRGSALCLAGDLERGMHVLDRAWLLYRDTGMHANTATWLASRALGLALQGRVDEAESSLAEARREVREHRLEFASSVVLIADAMVRHARGDQPERVRSAFREALDVAVSQGALGIARRVRRDAATCGIELDSGE